MGKVKEQAYLLPENLVPTEDFCAKVYIPNEDMYRRAFLGAYMFFGKWVAWERDSDHSALVAAARWRTAIERTMETWSDGCEGCDVTEEEIRQIIEEAFEAMSITINNCNCCGCSTCSGSGGVDDIPADIPINTDPPIVDVPSPGSNYATDDACAKAHFMAIEWRNMILAAENGDLNNERYNNWIVALFTETWDWVVDTAQVFLETVGVLSAVNSGTAAAIDAEFINLKCAILQGGSQAQIMANCNNVIDAMERSYLTTYYMKKVLGYMPLTAVFDDTVANPGAEYYVAGCPACVVQVPVFPEDSCMDADREFRIIEPESIQLYGTNTSQTFSTNAGIQTFTFSADHDSSYAAPRIEFTYPTVEAGKERIGYVYELLSSSRSNATGTDFDGISLDSDPAPITYCGNTQAAERECMASVVDELLGNIFASIANGAAANWTSIECELTRPATGTAVLSVQVRVWELVRTAP